MGEKKDYAEGNKPRSDKTPYKTVTATAVTRYDGIPELAGHVYIYGTGQADKFRKTTQAIGEYAGRVMMEEMYDLICNGKEGDFPEPTDLPDAEAKGTKLEKYRIQLKMILDKQEKYRADKARVFRLIVGQCVPMMKTKLEHSPTYKTLESAKDVIGLMKVMKTLVYSTTSDQYEFWTMQATLTTLLTLTQHDGENIATFGKKFMAQLEATELVWGTLIPQKYKVKTDYEQSAAMNKFLACVFLAGVDRHKYKPVIDELNNDFLLGKVTFPEDIPSMLTLLSNYRGGKGSNAKMEAMMDGVALQQTITRAPSWRAACSHCGSKQHKAATCPKKALADTEATAQLVQEGDDGDTDQVGWYGS